MYASVYYRAMDEPIEGGGTFDATGAFLDADEKNIGDKGKAHDTSQENVHRKMEKSSLKTNSIGDDIDKDNIEKKSSDNVRTNESDEKKLGQTDDTKIESLQKVVKREQELKSSELDGKVHARDDKAQRPNLGGHSVNTSKLGTRETHKIITETEQTNSTQNLTPIDRLQEVAEDIEKLIMDDDQSCSGSDEALLVSHVHGRDPHKHTTDVLADKKEIDRWYYRDPQGKVQGPFTATEMLEWYRAGYFDETLNVRRVCDPQFIELGDLLKACSGSIPFVSMPPPIIPPLLQSPANEINLNAQVPNVKPSTPTKPSANHLVHPGKMPPPSSANNPQYFDILQTQNFLGLMNQPPNDFRKLYIYK